MRAQSRGGKNVDSEARRGYIKRALEIAEERIRGADLARACQGSRQIIVGDVALLRASGMDIVSTPRGYYLKKKQKGLFRTFVCCHDRNDTEEELLAIVHAGGMVHNVVVEHDIYGELEGHLDIRNENDVAHFMKQIRETGASLLSSISGGIHTHLVETATEEEMKQVEEALRKCGMLYER